MIVVRDNILNFSDWLNQCNSVSRGTFTKSTDSITLTSTSADCYTDTYNGDGLRISVIAGKTYKLSWDSSGDGTQRIIVFSGESNVLKESNTSPISFTVPSGYNYIKFRFGISEIGKTITFSNVKISVTEVYYFVQKSDSYPVLENELSLPEVPSTPMPYKVFRQNSDINDGYPYIQDSYELVNLLQSPFPDFVLIQSANNYPRFPKLKLVNQGACGNATNLNVANIPKSVKNIGEWAFANTSIDKVIISSDCSFYPTSFPSRCNIEFYSDENSVASINDNSALVTKDNVVLSTADDVPISLREE